MSTRHLVDPALRAALDFFPQTRLTAESLATARENMRLMMQSDTSATPASASGSSRAW